MIFTNVIKPTHRCNLNCSYCYNDDIRNPIMRREILERVIEQTFTYVHEFHTERLVNFIWHGGEPMLAGLQFYNSVVELQQRLAGDISYTNSIQTNGLLIDRHWVEFFLEHAFSVSISIDGPAELNDKYRVDKRGKGTFERVFASIKRVQEAGLPLGVCVVISKCNIAYIDKIYDFLAENRLRFNIIPINNSGAARCSFIDIGLQADEYADAWIRMFDRWFDADHDYIYCSDFVFKTRAILAARPADCIGLKSCASTNISIDPIGHIFPCASLSGHTDMILGNVMRDNLKDLMSQPLAIGYSHRGIDRKCAKCKWQHICHGGCPARSYKFFGDYHRRDYYCPSLYKIYEHIERRVFEHGLRVGEPH